MVALGVDKNYDFAVDVGTDHAYIPIYLYKKGLIKRAVATDISIGSVEKANINIIKYNCKDIIETRCGNGLETIKEFERPDIVIIAGIGGILMVNILKKGIKTIENVKRMILQPQRDIYKVRKYIHSINFKIVDENMIFEAGKYYNVIICEHGKDLIYSETDYLFGKKLVDKKNSILKEFINHEMYKIDKAINFIKSNNKNNNIDKLNELNNKIKIYTEAKKCL